MTGKTEIKTGKLTAAGLTAAGLLFCAVRCLFAFETNGGVSEAHAPMSGDCVFYILYCAVFTGALVLLAFIGNKRRETFVPELLSFLLVTGLGMCRLYKQLPYSRAGILYLVMFLFAAAAAFFDFYYAFALLPAVFYFLLPQMLPLCLVFTAYFMLPYCFGKDVKKKNASLLVSAAAVLTAAGLFGWYISHGEISVQARLLPAAETVIALIFLALITVPCVCVIRKKPGRYGLAEAVLPLVIFVGVLLSSVLFPETLPPREAVIMGISLAVLCLTLATARENSALGREVSRLCENRILLLLLLAFTARAAGYIFVRFEDVII